MRIRTFFFCNNLIEYICNVCKCMKLSHYSFLTWLLMCGLKWEIAGGTFALYSLLCKHSQVGILTSRRVESNLGLEHATQYAGMDKHNRLRNFFEQSMIARRVLLFVAMLGTCMLIGDGILTPAISGLWMNILYFSSSVRRSKIQGMHSIYRPGVCIVAISFLTSLFWSDGPHYG